MIINNGFPEYDTANNWNDKIAFTKYRPDNTSVHGTESIRDAWVKLISINPSVLDNSSGQLWIDDQGEVYTQFGFSFVVPKEMFPGDCNTVYEVCGYDYSMGNYLNGQLLSNSKKSNFSASGGYNSSQLFTAKLRVNSQYLIHHYQLIEHCDEFGCWYSCDYYKTDDKQSTLEIQDAKQTYQYGFIDFPNGMIDENTSDYVVGWLFVASNEDYNNIRFVIGNSELKLQSRQYQFKVENAPYNSLAVETSVKPYKFYTRNIGILENQNGLLSGQDFEDYLKRSEPVLYYILHDILGINVSILPIQFKYNKIHFTAPTNSTSCTLEIYSHFETKRYSNLCKNPNQKPTINLTIENYSQTSFTIKAVFYDKISGSALAGKKIQFTYGNESRTMETDLHGIAVASFNRTDANLVKADFFTDFETKSTHAEAYLPPFFSVGLDLILFIVGLLISAFLFYKWVRGAFK